LPKKSPWSRKLEQKAREFASVCVSSLFSAILGLVFPTFFVVFELLAFLILFVGTLAVLGLTD